MNNTRHFRDNTDENQHKRVAYTFKIHQRLTIFPSFEKAFSNPRKTKQIPQLDSQNILRYIEVLPQEQWVT